MYRRRLVFTFAIFLAAASGQSPEAAVLGGACVPGNSFPSDLVRKHSAAERAGDRAAQIQLAKEIVRHACSNDHWWLKLAEMYFTGGQAGEAVQVLDAYYAKGGSNAVVARLSDTEWPLHKVTASAAYRNSGLAKTIDRDRVALEKRRREAQARMAKQSRPPEQYVSKNACPFECCVFRLWSVKAETTLYDKPGGSQVVATVRKGARVRGLTGEVHLRPAPVLVRYKNPEGLQANPGDIVYLLNYTGEGHGFVWQNGKSLDAEVMWVAEHCPAPEAECWGEFVNPQDAGQIRKHVWWVKVRTSKGVVGWTDKADNFGDKDACG